MTAKTPEAPPAEATSKETPEPATQEKQPSTTEKMFPDFFVEGEDGKKEITAQRQDPEAPAPPDEKKPEEKAPEAPPKPPEAKAPEYLDISQISGKLVRTKVDGVETDVPAEELLKNYQLDRHLTQRSQSLAEQEKALKELHGELNKIKGDMKNTAKGEDGGTPDPRIETVLKKIDDLEQKISKPAVFTKAEVDNNMARIAAEVQKNLGYDDFMDMIPQITAEISKHFVNPKAPTEKELEQFDTMANWYQTYQAVKLRSFKAAPPPAPSAPPAKGAPVLDKKPPLPPAAIEEAGGASDGSEAESSGWKVRYDAALKVARESGTDESWQAVFRLKRERPDS